MSLLLALALTQAALPVAAPVAAGAVDARRPLSLWIGGDDRLSFAFGQALGRSLAASPTVRQAVPIGTAEYRLVLRQIRLPKQADARFAYAADLIQPREPRRGRARERIVQTVRGRCTQATLDTCAGDIANHLSSRLGS